MLKAIGEGGTSEFALQLKQARDKIFHYQRLVVGDGEEHDLIKKTLRGLARKEAKEGKVLGEIEDSAPLEPIAALGEMGARNRWSDLAHRDRGRNRVEQ